MISIEFYKKQNNIVKFVMKGHAEYGEGDDIVCAAASSVAWMTVNGIENVAGIHCGYETGDGYIFFVLPDDLSNSEAQNADLLLNSFFMYIRHFSDNIIPLIKLLHCNLTLSN